jgi:hypothetical protein
MVQAGEADPEKKGGARRGHTDQAGMGMKIEINGGRGPVRKMSTGQAKQVKEKGQSSGRHSRRSLGRYYSVRQLACL